MRFLLFILIIFIPSISKAIHKNSPAFMSSDFTEYNSEEDFIYAKGNVYISMENYSLRANQLLYDIKNDEIWAEGNVVVKDNKNKTIYGEFVVFKNNFKKGVISEFILKFSDNIILSSRLAQKINEDQSILTKTTFTPCSISCNKKPIWQLSAQKTFLDFKKQKISYQNAFFEIYGIPIFYLPYFAHPMPKSDAQSGILRPLIRDHSIKIPIYFRIKPNFDITITPRIAKKYNMIELEARHRTNNGSEILQASYNKTQYLLKDKGKILKDKKMHRYHIFTSGNFNQNNNIYGFSAKHTSDKAYLKNYYNLYDPYLSSRIYFYEVDNDDYFLIEALNFQNLENIDNNDYEPIILPKIKTKNIFNLRDDTDFILKTDSLTYKEFGGKQLAKSSINQELKNDFLITNGSLIELIARDRMDFYWMSDLTKDNDRELSLYRNIPEIETSFRHPLVKNFNDKLSLNIEPIISCIVSRNYRNNDKKFGLIDPNQVEISDNNLFLANKYSGTDYYEFGNRINYGINTGMISRDNYFSVFVGQSIKDKPVNSYENRQFVSRIGMNFLNQLEIFYRFRKSEKLESVIDEVGIYFNSQNINFISSIIMLNNIKKYHLIEHLDINNNRFSQSFHDITYLINENWQVGYDLRLDMSSKKYRIISKSMRVTYLNDCVSIGGKIQDYYTSDEKIGIKKTRTQSFSIGLKLLNT